MDWYKKLNQYFPVEEMKSQQHMELLLNEKSDVYYKDEGPHHVLMYAEFPTFIFIDYVYVSKESRGKGIGHQIIDKLKQKSKPIILEVEPFDYQDSDSTKRLRFYQREGFKHAVSIGYTRKSLATDEANTLEILYWSPRGENEEEIYEQMKKMYEDIHTYKDQEVYGKSYQPVEEVLTYNDDRETDNIFDVLDEKKKK
ncbi:GNAT family N-acetyltransferase [Gracilibacillus kekensis]|uniref:Acetyltransferase (GNAT) domain-containing protein n=1 Tax=Gracilibacillus kekensis TaxID=1027249 RepID=A0A1M7IMK6_9BACI|nr:GNAT family N-acetyltransferase [Gracilibacillus kekensis]SHM41833.1 Acetyltransferase (GNAT) domain-containing protein [Gracilibacillus kekensis]